MCVLGVRWRVKTEEVSEAEAAIEKAFSTIAEAQPQGVRYASIKASDGATFMALELEKEEESRVTHDFRIEHELQRRER